MQEKIAAFEKILLRNLKLMRHRQVIHPVLQEGEYLLVFIWILLASTKRTLVFLWSCIY